MKRLFAFLLILVFVCGCSPQLKTIIRLSNEQKAQQKYVAVQSKKFKLLLRHIEKDRLKLGLSSRKIIALYGDPVTINDLDAGMEFLYREPLDYNPTQKVYLYFGEEDTLVHFELVIRESPEGPSQ